MQNLQMDVILETAGSDKSRDLGSSHFVITSTQLGAGRMGTGMRREGQERRS